MSYHRTNSSIVTIDLSNHPPQTPLGMLLAPSALPNESHSCINSYIKPPRQNDITLVAGWERLPCTKAEGTLKSSQLGPIQRSGSVRLGDRLVRINGRDVTDWSFREVMDTLRQFVADGNSATNGSNITNTGEKRLKSLGFAPRHSHEWTKNTQFDDTVSPTLFGLFNGDKTVHEKRLYSFASYVGRWRVMIDGNENGIAERDDASAFESDLEQHLNKEPMRPGAARPHNDSDTKSTKPKPYIQYEIQCHLLFHPKITFTRRQSHASYSWSVWKRYSQFKSLDAELRSMHGWQMDALDEGRGIYFPSGRCFETFWYDVYGAVNNFLSSDTATILEEEKNGKDQEENTETNCPYPAHFVTKRQKELCTYWSQLMRIEDLFEFDISSHRFAKSMALFLEADRILMKRAEQSTSGSVTSRMRPPVIHEDLTDVGELILPSTTMPVREDDDVSLLSDGTGLRDSLVEYVSPLRNALMNPPQTWRVQYGGGMSSNSSVVSGASIGSSGMRVGMTSKGVRQGAKPAFQREFL